MKKKNVASMKAEMEKKDDRYKRIMAEFENYKKRSAKERETLYESIISEIVDWMVRKGNQGSFQHRVKHRCAAGIW